MTETDPDRRETTDNPDQPDDTVSLSIEKGEDSEELVEPDVTEKDADTVSLIFKKGEDSEEPVKLDVIEKDVAQEKTRSTLAILLVSFLGGSIAFSFLIIFLILCSNLTSEDKLSFTKDTITLLVTTQVGIVGSAIGFYFGKVS
ncbi:MAG: hypothetical protein AB4038_21655 [Prochloraceae cyanobacterium]